MSLPNDDQTESEYVKLNVGGTLFYTTIGTLTKFEENMLAAMFSGRMERKIDKEGWVFIDRSGKHFAVILNFLRDGTVPLPKLNTELAELRAEANFFCITQLVELCDQALVAPIEIHDFENIASMVLEKPLSINFIKSLTKPAVILQLSVGCYTPKHLLFFEKLAFEFHEHILFIRYVENLNEWNGSRGFICKWNFFINGEQPFVLGTEELQEDIIRRQVQKMLFTLIPKL